MTEATETAVRGSLVDEVAGRLRKLIDDGPFQTGDRLPSEAELVDRLGVSRPVLREAIGRLGAMGLVEVRRGRGTFVAERNGLLSAARLVGSAMAISTRDLAKLTELRTAVECQAARRAAESATAADLAEIEALCARMDAGDLPQPESMKVDFEFHRRIAAVSGNEVLVRVLEVIQEFVLESMVRTTPSPRDRDWSENLHRNILEAVRSGDPDRAERAMRNHMDAVQYRLRLGSSVRLPPEMKEVKP
jgi:GntR family transcriptional repressor for pyruvate dehydrogenase complex